MCQGRRRRCGRRSQFAASHSRLTAPRSFIPNHSAIVGALSQRVQREDDRQRGLAPIESWWDSQCLPRQRCEDHLNSHGTPSALSVRLRRALLPRALRDTRFLSADAPPLPLPECSSPWRCKCIYVHFADRRTKPRRATDRGGFARPRFGKERRALGTSNEVGSRSDCQDVITDSRRL